MTVRHRLARRWRRLLLLPTGSRRRRAHDAAADYPPRPTYPPRPVEPPPTRAAITGARGSDGAEVPVVKITAMETPATGTPVPRLPSQRGVSAVIVPRQPEVTPDEFLMTEGWDRIFDDAEDAGRESLVDFTIRRGGGATTRVSETTIELPKILAQPLRVAHLCRCCWTLSSGDQLTAQLWRCDECRQIAAY